MSKELKREEQSVDVCSFEFQINSVYEGFTKIEKGKTVRIEDVSQAFLDGWRFFEGGTSTHYSRTDIKHNSLEATQWELRHNYEVFFEECLPQFAHDSYAILLRGRGGRPDSLLTFSNFDFLLGLSSTLSWVHGDPSLIQHVFHEGEECSMFYRFSHSVIDALHLVLPTTLVDCVTSFFPKCETERCETIVFEQSNFCHVCALQVNDLFLTSVCLEKD